jgi:hypothetical protein
LIVLAGIFEIRQMIKDGLKKEIAVFITLAAAALALAWLYVYCPDVSISAFLLKSFGIPF